MVCNVVIALLVHLIVNAFEYEMNYAVFVVEIDVMNYAK
jgi:hypothetical protein